MGQNKTLNVFLTEKANAVTLHFVPFERELTAELQHQQCILSVDEVERISRYQKQVMQLQAMQVRVELRTKLTDYAIHHGLHAITPSDWYFIKGKWGKPKLSDEQFKQTGIHFNLSHSGDWLLLAITHVADPEKNISMGVDIERSRENTHYKTILNRYFARSEIDDLLALSQEADQKQRFYDLWACKESYIKATGKGLATKLDSFAFDLSKIVFLQKESLLLSNKIELKALEETEGAYFSILGRLDVTYRFALTLLISAKFNDT
ncbi:MAG: 4'-phosphopantetheinyl transferase family protein [Parashewanella sp.]